MYHIVIFSIGNASTGKIRNQKLCANIVFEFHICNDNYRIIAFEIFR